MNENPTPEQQLGELAARALDGMKGRPIIGAVLLLTVEESEDHHSSVWFTPERQPWQLTLGTIEDWRIMQQALITASAINPTDDDEGDDQ